MTDEQLEQMRQKLREEEKRVDFFILLLQYFGFFLFFTIPLQIVLGLVFAALAYWQLAALAFGGAWLVAVVLFYFWVAAEERIYPRMRRKIDKKWDDWNKERWRIEEARKSSSGINMYT